jgi:hypothetical protein
MTSSTAGGAQIGADEAEQRAVLLDQAELLPLNRAILD